jgi:hypothetical protein
VLAVVLLGVVLGGCTGDDTGGQAPDTRGHSSPDVLPTSEATVVVPDLIGMSRTEAEAAIEAAGLLPVVATAEGEQDDVISQTPAVGERVEPGHEVTILVRCPAAPCPYPGEGETIYDPCGCLHR